MSNKESKEPNLKVIIELDKIIHEPARLLIMSHLYVLESADYLFLRAQTDLTWGNLSSHMSKLEAAGFVEIEKTYVRKKPHTIAKLTTVGRKAFEDYREKLKQVIL